MTPDLRSCTASQRSILDRTLVAIPIYNEQKHVGDVLGKVRRFAPNVLAIDDGSTDHTPTLLAMHPVEVIRHAVNRGYGRSMLDAFRWAAVDRHEWVITMDCDEQHEPAAIPFFREEAGRGEEDVISGSRYLLAPDGESPPPDRRAIYATITQELNERLGLGLTDAFCGFKAYRVEALRELALDVDGYAFPMQFWVQARAAGVRIREIPVRLIYNDPTRTFGGPLNDPTARLAHYRCVLHRELVLPVLGADVDHLESVEIDELLLVFERLRKVVAGVDEEDLLMRRDPREHMQQKGRGRRERRGQHDLFGGEVFVERPDTLIDRQVAVLLVEHPDAFQVELAFRGGVGRLLLVRGAIQAHRCFLLGL